MEATLVRETADTFEIVPATETTQAENLIPFTSRYRAKKWIQSHQIDESEPAAPGTTPPGTTQTVYCKLHKNTIYVVQLHNRGGYKNSLLQYEKGIGDLSEFIQFDCLVDIRQVAREGGYTIAVFHPSAKRKQERWKYHTFN